MLGIATDGIWVPVTTSGGGGGGSTGGAPPPAPPEAPEVDEIVPVIIDVKEET